MQHVYQVYFGTVKKPIFNASNRVTAYYVLFDGYDEDDKDESSYYSAPNIRKGVEHYKKFKDEDPAMQEDEVGDDNPTTTTQSARTKRTHYPELIDAVSKADWLVICIIFLHLLFCLFVPLFVFL